MKQQLAGVLCATMILFGLTSSHVSATVTYQYEGSDYNTAVAPYDTSMNINVTLELLSLLGSNLLDATVIPVSFSVFDGVNTLNGSNTDQANFAFSTDSSGNIIDWSFFIQDTPTVFGVLGVQLFSNSTLASPGFTVEAVNRLDCLDANCIGGVQVLNGAGGGFSLEGVWSVNAVPIPAAVWLFGSGLIGLIGIARRKAHV